MTDPFAVLDLPARPWLEPEVLRDALLRRSETLHRTAGSEQALMAVNRAYGLLANPATRIESLLPAGADRAARQIAPTVGAFFGEVAESLQQADRFLSELPGQTSSLARAVRAVQSQDLRAVLERLANSLAEETARCHRDLQALDGEWARDPGGAQAPLAQLALDLTFLQRWLGQLRERLLRLDEATG